MMIEVYHGSLEPYSKVCPEQTGGLLRAKQEFTPGKLSVIGTIADTPA